MAVTLSASTLAVDLTITAARAQELIDVAGALIDNYAGDRPPEALQNEAARRLIAYLVETPAAPVRAEQEGELRTEYAISHHGAMQHSGAKSLLSPWTRRRAGLIAGRQA